MSTYTMAAKLDPYPQINGNINIVKNLIESSQNDPNVNINKQYLYCRGTLLHYAAMNDWLDIVEYLLDRGANINQIDNYGYTALHDAASAGNFEIVMCLLEHGADPDCKTVTGMTAAVIATKSCRYDTRIAEYIKAYDDQYVPTKGVHME
jgi:ankyrin repeat protein